MSSYRAIAPAARPIAPPAPRCRPVKPGSAPVTVVRALPDVSEIVSNPAVVATLVSFAALGGIAAGRASSYAQVQYARAG